MKSQVHDYPAYSCKRRLVPSPGHFGVVDSDDEIPPSSTTSNRSSGRYGLQSDDDDEELDNVALLAIDKYNMPLSPTTPTRQERGNDDEHEETREHAPESLLAVLLQTKYSSRVRSCESSSAHTSLTKQVDSISASLSRIVHNNVRRLEESLRGRPLIEEDCYEQLHVTERARREESLAAATARGLTLALEQALRRNPLSIADLKSALAESKGKVDEELSLRAEVLLRTAEGLLARVAAATENVRNRADEAILRGLLDSELVHSLRSEPEIGAAREQLLLHPIVEEVSTEERVNTQEASRHAVVFDFEYIRSGEARIRWLSAMRVNASLQQIPGTVSVALVEVLSALRYLVMMEVTRVEQVIDAVAAVSTLLRGMGSTVDNSALIAILIAILSEVLAGVSNAVSPSATLALAVALQGISASLGSGLRKVFSLLLFPLLYEASSACTPDLSFIRPADGNFLAFIGALVEGGTTGAVLTSDWAWTWLVRACRQLHLLISSGEQELIEHGSRCISAYLEHCGTFLRRCAGSQLRALLERLRPVVGGCTGEGARRLLSIVEQAVAGELRSHTLLSLPSHVIANKIFIGSLREFVLSVMQLEDGAADLRQRAAVIGLDQLGGEFNKLGPSSESQARVIKGVIDIANRAGGDTAMVNCTLYKASGELIGRARSQQFFVSAGHPTHLARIAVGLCGVKPDMGHLIRAQFNKSCPLTVPYWAEELGSRDEYCRAMGYKRVEDRSGAEGWESNEQYLKRELSVLVTYFTILIQPEQQPLQLADGFSWLVAVLNMSRTSRKCPFMVAAILDATLRTMSERMLAVYGGRFMDLLRVVDTQVLGLLDSSTPKGKIEIKRLEQFLRAAISSDGKELLKL